MNDVWERINFDEYNPLKQPYIEYEATDYVPLCTDFVCDEERSIVLKNKETGRLELLKYIMVGGMPAMVEEGFMWYYGRVIPECGIDLVFDFGYTGKLKTIRATFAAPTKI